MVRSLKGIFHPHMNPRMLVEKRKKGIDLMMENPANILKVSGNLESIMLSVFGDYSEYLKTYDKQFTYYKENEGIRPGNAPPLLSSSGKRLDVD